MEKYFFLSFISCVLITSLFGQSSTGFLSPTSITAPFEWTNPTDAFVSDDMWTTAPQVAGCRCPYISLSWNNGSDYCPTEITGPFPFGAPDIIEIYGYPSDTWGHNWSPSELSNTNFILKIGNPTQTFEQGYNNFNFNIPNDATINGIEVKIEVHADDEYTTVSVDLIQVNIYYTSITGVAEYSASNNRVSFYPNPFSSSTVLKNNNNLTNASLKIYNSVGLIVKQIENISGQEFEIHRDNLSNGIYYVCVIQNTEAVIKGKLIIID